MKIEKTVDRGSREKLYVQIYSIFLEKIESGEWPPETQIPTEDELCRTYDVSKVTVREAIQELVREGYLKRQQGKGTFVTYSVPHPGLMMRTRLSEDIYGEGVEVRREVIEKGIKEPAEDIKKALMTEESLYYILCKKSLDGETYKEESFVPMFVLPEIAEEELLNRSLYDLIEEKGTKKIFRIIQTIEVTILQHDAAALLTVEEGSPALLVNRILMSSDGNPIACTRHIMKGTSRVQMEFERLK